MANDEDLGRIRQGAAVWNDWRAKNPERRVDLRGARLRGANLEGANLHEANLGGANLEGANLRRANLRRAKLEGANLRRAKLEWARLLRANLEWANLHEANLEWANLERANLGGAYLSGAYLGGAKLYETVFADVDLSATKDLGACTHGGPSIIDHRTLQRSGDLPLAFLRGCGLPDRMIEEATQFYSCFISYSHADQSFGRRLHDQLQGRGIRCWLDEKQLLPGDDIYEQVDRGIRLWDKVLLCCSQASLRSWWVDNEIDTAFEKERRFMRDRGQRVLALIPIDLDGYLHSGLWRSGKERAVKQRLTADFVGWEYNNQKFEEQLERVVNALRTGEGAREPPPEPRL